MTDAVPTARVCRGAGGVALIAPGLWLLATGSADQPPWPALQHHLALRPDLVTAVAELNALNPKPDFVVCQLSSDGSARVMVSGRVYAVVTTAHGPRQVYAADRPADEVIPGALHAMLALPGADRAPDEPAPAGVGHALGLEIDLVAELHAARSVPQASPWARLAESSASGRSTFESGAQPAGPPSAEPSAARSEEAELDEYDRRFGSVWGPGAGTPAPSELAHKPSGAGAGYPPTPASATHPILPPPASEPTPPGFAQPATAPVEQRPLSPAPSATTSSAAAHAPSTGHPSGGLIENVPTEILGALVVQRSPRRPESSFDAMTPSVEASPGGQRPDRLAPGRVESAQTSGGHPPVAPQHAPAHPAAEAFAHGSGTSLDIRPTPGAHLWPGGIPAPAEPMQPSSPFSNEPAVAPSNPVPLVGGAASPEAVRAPSPNAAAQPTVDPSGGNAGRTVSRASLAAAYRQAVPTVAAVRCAQGHLTSAYALACRVCRGPIPMPQEAVEIPRPPLGRLLFPGTEILLDADVVLGRSPYLPAGQRPGARLVSINDPRHEVSSQHALVTLEHWQVSITDLGSTNGTEVVYPDGRRQRLVPHAALVIEPGVIIVLAEILDIRFEATA